MVPLHNSPYAEYHYFIAYLSSKSLFIPHLLLQLLLFLIIVKVINHIFDFRLPLLILK